MKKLHRLKSTKNTPYEKLAGIALKKERIVAVNIQLLWEFVNENYKNKENAFIKLFSEYYTHEWLHLYFNDLGTDYGEEVVIRRLLNQPMDKETKAFYMRMYE